MLVYVIIFFVLTLLAVEYEIQPFKKKNELLLFLLLALTFFVGFRDITVDRDYKTYLNNFYIITHFSNPGGTGILPLFEPGFVLIVDACYNLFTSNYAIAVMVVFAWLTLSLKFYVIRKLAINPFLVILLYYSYFFLYQEMTQIRNGLACSLFFLAVLCYLNKHRSVALLFILLATTIHQSSILYLLIFLIDARSFNAPKYIFIFLAGITFGLIRLPILALFSNVNLGDISNKLATYQQLTQVGFVDDVNFFNVINIVNILVTAYIIYHVVRYKISDYKLILFLKFNIISIFIFGFLVDFSSVAFRITELFWVYFVFLFSYLTNLLPFKKMNIFIVVAIAFLYFYINIFYVELLQPYKLVTFN